MVIFPSIFPPFFIRAIWPNEWILHGSYDQISVVNLRITVCQPPRRAASPRVSNDTLTIRTSLPYTSLTLLSLSLTGQTVSFQMAGTRWKESVHFDLIYLKIGATLSWFCVCMFVYITKWINEITRKYTHEFRVAEQENGHGRLNRLRSMTSIGAFLVWHLREQFMLTVDSG